VWELALATGRQQAGLGDKPSPGSKGCQLATFLQVAEYEPLAAAFAED